ncbi:MAG: anaerobic ribonucleoside-triphosphate reductase activating protein [Lachnospiraceae bacterium]|nr:anaerobic ribonucleoside-triphosphate reductase activating protein [Lachnospiraceae bacterium]
MVFYGLQKTTLLDYPGHVAATIFTGGCNFRCPFCHNMNLVNLQGKDSISTISEADIFSFLQKRCGVLDGICVTGGEPTLNDGLGEFLSKVKKINTNSNSLLIKLDTNGTNPEMIKDLIDKGLIDYVAMDIKSSEDDYYKAAGINEEDKFIDSIKQSVSIIINSNIDYEFRTTVVDGLHDIDSIKGIGQLIKGAKRHYLQAFKESEFVCDKSFSTPDDITITKYKEIMKDYVDEAYIRGVD